MIHMTPKLVPSKTVTAKSRRAPDAGQADARLDSKSPLPLYHRLYVILRERITNGSYRVGELLPPENELMNTFGVARITVKRALNDLASEGLVERSRGRGTTVIQNGASMRIATPIAASIDGLLASLSAIGQGTSVELKRLEYVAANKFIAEQLNIPAGTVVQHASRVRYFKKQAFSYSQSYLLENIGQSFDAADMIKMPLIDLIRRAGITIARVQQAITCTLADHTSSRYLGVDIGNPLLKLRRVFFDENDKAVNYAEILYTPERFEYRMTWSRGANNELKLDAGEKEGLSKR